MKAPKVEAAHIVNKLLFLHNLLSVVCAFPHPPAPACAHCGAHGMCLMSGKKEDSNERLRVGFPAAEVLNGWQVFQSVQFVDLPKEFLETLRLNTPLSVTSGTFVVTFFFLLLCCFIYLLTYFFYFYLTRIILTNSHPEWSLKLLQRLWLLGNEENVKQLLLNIWRWQQEVTFVQVWIFQLNHLLLKTTGCTSVDCACWLPWMLRDRERPCEINQLSSKCLCSA